MFMPVSQLVSSGPSICFHVQVQRSMCFHGNIFFGAHSEALCTFPDVNQRPQGASAGSTANSHLSLVRYTVRSGSALENLCTSRYQGSAGFERCPLRPSVLLCRHVFPLASFWQELPNGLPGKALIRYPSLASVNCFWSLYRGRKALIEPFKGT